MKTTRAGHLILLGCHSIFSFSQRSTQGGHPALTPHELIANDVLLEATVERSDGWMDDLTRGRRHVNGVRLHRMCQG
jgi:hypothetical protein